MRNGLKLFLFLILPVVFTACAGKMVRPDYSKYVWPPPPDAPRVQLEDILYGRADVEAKSNLQRALLGAAPGAYDLLRKPFAVAYDHQGRILVTDQGLSALLRFDRTEGLLDVLGTRGPMRLRIPMGLDIGPDGTIFVADIGLKRVVALDPQGGLRGVFGHTGELENPTDAALSPDGAKLYVADSKAHQIVVFDIETAEIQSRFGGPGEGEGEFNYPTSLAFSVEGDLLVVDQLNSRVQVLTEEGEFLDQFGALGVGFGDFVRPKDVTVDEQGFIYVSDAAFNNLQLFDSDFSLLTYVGTGGRRPGQFKNASGVAVHGQSIAVVDQLNRRVQLFRFLPPEVTELVP